MKPGKISGIKKDIIRGFFVFFIAIGILGAILLNTIFIESFEKLEKEDAIKTVDVVKNEINFRLKDILTSASDWGTWDETYLYTQGLNTNYIESNLVDDTFDSLNFDICIIADDSGNVLYGKQIDFETDELKVIDQSVSKMLKVS